MVAPEDNEVRQAVSVLELQNSDLWLRPIDLSWHFPILVTIREESFKNYRSRTDEVEGEGEQGRRVQDAVEAEKR